MKVFLCAMCLALSAAHVPAQEAVPLGDAPVICGPDTVAIFEDTKSPDGRYAIGWTIRSHPGKPPIDWSEYKPGNPYAWASAYSIDDEESKGDYTFFDDVLDLHDKQFIPFKSDLPRFPGKTTRTWEWLGPTYSAAAVSRSSTTIPASPRRNSG